MLFYACTMYIAQTYLIILRNSIFFSYKLKTLPYFICDSMGTCQRDLNYYKYHPIYLF